MKHYITLVLLFLAMTLSAQNKQKDTFTPKQKAQLEAKELVLKLDLSDAQYNKVNTLYQKHYKRSAELKNRKARVSEMNSDEKFKLKNDVLDIRIKFQRNMKNILNETQYQQWRKSKAKKHYLAKSKHQGMKKRAHKARS